MIETDREGKTPGSVLCGLVYAPGCALLVTFHVYDAKKILVDALGMTRVNSTNVLDEGLEIREIGRRMNLKEKISQTRRVSRINVVVNLTYSQSVPDRPLLAPIYRWPGLKDPFGFDTYYNIGIRHELVFQL
jgi:hypothetical protein